MKRRNCRKPSGGDADDGLSAVGLWGTSPRPRGAFAVGWPGRGSSRWERRLFGVCLILGVLVMAAAPGCSRRPDSHASASRQSRVAAKAVVRGKSGRLNARVAVFGAVTVAGSGPVPGCRVEAFSSGKPQVAVGPFALTNAAGMFALAVELSPGRYVFEVSKGKASVHVPVVVSPSAGWYKLLNVELPHAASGTAAQPGRSENGGTAVFGQITKPGGVKPFSGVLVWIGRPRRVGGPLHLVARAGGLTGKSGLFAMGRRLAPGKYWVVAARARFRHGGGSKSGGMATPTMVALPRLVVVASSRQDIVLRLKAGAGSVAGRVVSAAGRPVAGASIFLQGASYLNQFTWFRTHTDTKGRYLIRYVPLGLYVGDAGWKGHSSRERVVVVGKQPARKDFRIAQ